MTKILLSCALAAAGGASAAVDGQASSAPLNILIIDICAARADHFGAYGYPKRTTPGMDAVAKDSALFENSMSQASWCLSNYASLFTGQPPEVHGLYAMASRKLPDSLPTLAEKLKGAGYDTAAWSGGTWLLPIWGLERGFDHYVNTLSTTHVLTAFSQRMPEMLDWVRERGGRPFFLYASIEDLHLPYAPDLELAYEPESDAVVLDGGRSRAPLLRTFEGAMVERTEPSPAMPGLHAGGPALAAADRLHVEPMPPPRTPLLGRWDPLPRLTAKYDGSLARADAEIARFLDRIKEMGLWENTLIIITGDHGESLGEHGLTGHMEGLYEATAHVPLILRHPGFPQSAGRRFKELVVRTDLTPTVLEAAGVSYEGMGLQGRSLLSLFGLPGAPWRRYAFAASKRSTTFAADFMLDERVARDERWKLHWYLHKGRYELYDLVQDPREERDLSRERSDIVARLAFEMVKELETARPHAPGLPSGLTPEQAEPRQVLPRPRPD